LFKFTTDIGAAVAPLIIEQILIYVSLKSSKTPQSLGLGLTYVALLFIVTMVSSLSIAQFFQRVNGIGMSVRSVLTVVIHQKSLRLSSSARQTFDSGKIMNMIATDSVRIDQFTMFFHLIWTYSIQLFVIIGLLVYIIGISALAGVGLILVVVPLQVMIARWLVVLRKTNATITDSRIKLTQEVLQGIRIIKLFSWESSFLDRILSVRALEFLAVVKANLIRSCLVALGFTMPALAASLTFIVDGIMKPSIDPVTVR
jgi:ABC-type multidrug transport system fused ATPase/permease subunit